MTALPAPGDVDAREAALAELGGGTQALRRLVEEATATPIHISYRLGPEWFDGVAHAIDQIEQHLDQGAIAAMLLSEHMLERLEAADLDDSDGWLMQAFPRLERLHAAASKAAGIAPVVLARRLKALAAASEMEAFVDAPYTHERALGDRGIDELLRP